MKLSIWCSASEASTHSSLKNHGMVWHAWALSVINHTLSNEHTDCSQSESPLSQLQSGKG